jgi:hypothetical protein
MPRYWKWCRIMWGYRAESRDAPALIFGAWHQPRPGTSLPSIDLSNSNSRTAPSGWLPPDHEAISSCARIWLMEG